MLFRTLFVAGVLFLWACSADNPMDPEPVPESGVPISLAGNLPEDKEMTRAVGLENKATSFKVWSYKEYASSAVQCVMPCFTVNWTANTAYTTTSNTADWEYVGQAANQEIKYWDFNAKAYRFFGYALGTATSPATPNSVTVGGGLPADAVTLTSTVDASTDAGIEAAPYFTQLWYSDGTAPNRPFGQAVQLRFLKPFARVRFLFFFVDGLNFDRESLKNIKFCPKVNYDVDDTNDQIIPTSGTITVSYPLTGSATTETWTTTNTTGIKQFLIDYYETPDPIPNGFPVNNLPASWPNTPGKWYTVLPALNQGDYIIQVAVVSEELKTAIVPAEYMSWLPGYEYTYKFKITETGGITMDVIQVAINDWSNKKDSEHAVYNW